MLPAEAEVDLGAIRANVASLTRHAPSAEVMAVVKADAYGHGLVPWLGRPGSGGASWLGVAQLAEACGCGRPATPGACCPGCTCPATRSRTRLLPTSTSAPARPGRVDEIAAPPGPPAAPPGCT